MQQTVALSSMSMALDSGLSRVRAAHSLGTRDVSVHLFQDSSSLEARPRSPSRGDWNYFHRTDGVFKCVKTESISAPASPTRHRLGCPSRTPALRHHIDFGAKHSPLTSLVFGERGEDCSPSFACGKRRLERKTRPFSGTLQPRQRGAECSDLQQWIWSFVVPYLIFVYSITLLFLRTRKPTTLFFRATEWSFPCSATFVSLIKCQTKFKIRQRSRKYMTESVRVRNDLQPFMWRNGIWLLASELFWDPPPGTDTQWTWRHRVSELWPPRRLETLRCHARSSDIPEMKGTSRVPRTISATLLTAGRFTEEYSRHPGDFTARRIKHSLCTVCVILRPRASVNVYNGT